MCGLVGVFGNTNFRMQNIFKDLLQIDVIRGHHSTGVGFANTNKDKELIVLKEACLPQTLMRAGEFKSGINQDNILKMGHNRLATVGEVNQINAHPFVNRGKAGRFLGAHNGTLRNKWELEKELGSNFATDSQAFFALISEKGLGEAWKTMRGAAAVSLFDTENQCLTLATNGERPLHYTILPSKRQVIWASEGWMIQAACFRRNVEPGKVISIPKNKGALFWLKGDAVKHQVFKLEPRPFGYEKNHTRNWYKEFGAKSSLQEGDSWWEWSTDHDQWVVKEVKNGKVVETPMGRQHPSRHNLIDNRENIRFKSWVNRKEQTDQWGCFSSIAVYEDSFHEHFNKCITCKDTLINEYGTAMIVDEKKKRAICSECYEYCIQADFDPTGEWS